MPKHIFRLFFISLLLLNNSCTDDSNPLAIDEIIGSGNFVDYERSLTGFFSVTNEIVAEININHGDIFSFSFSVDENIEKYITSTISNGELVISKSSDINLSDYTLTIDIVMPALKIIALEGVGSFNAGTFNEDSIWLDQSGVGTISLNSHVEYLNSTLAGPGNISLSGTATKHIATHSSIGSLGAYSLNTDTTIITISGVGNAYVDVSDYLNATVSGIGSIYYQGSPVIETTVTGTGVVEPKP